MNSFWQASMPNSPLTGGNGIRKVTWQYIGVSCHSWKYWLGVGQNRLSFLLTFVLKECSKDYIAWRSKALYLNSKQIQKSIRKYNSTIHVWANSIFYLHGIHSFMSMSLPIKTITLKLWSLWKREWHHAGLCTHLSDQTANYIQLSPNTWRFQRESFHMHECG